MSNEGVDVGKRRFLTTATTAVGGVGAAFVAVPFIKSWQPSARAEAAAAPVEVNIGELQQGAMLTVTWRGKPVWVVKRTEEMLATLDEVSDRLRDPESEKDQQPPYARNRTRSLKPEVLVMVGICTHLGCSPKYRPDAAQGDMPYSGFFCPCHGSKFDIAGRVYQGVPAPLNMVVPPHRYKSENVLVIGEDPNESETA